MNVLYAKTMGFDDNEPGRGERNENVVTSYSVVWEELNRHTGAPLVSCRSLFFLGCDELENK